MDITTLAAANAYTDKKVAEGGGSGGGGGLPVVELETFPSADGVAMSASDNAKLTAAIGKPIIIKINVSEAAFVLVFSYYVQPPHHAFVCYLGVINIVFQSSDGVTWTGMQAE